MPIPLQESLVYGPVPSRRFGASLGINLLPVTRKLCSSDCVYCQYGWTPRGGNLVPEMDPIGRASPPKLLGGPRADLGIGRASPPKSLSDPMANLRIGRSSELLPLLREGFGRIASEGIHVDHITLAGNGEPTLHPDLEEIIIGTKLLRDEWFPRIPVGILSDSTTVYLPRVRRALELLDECWMKLDVGNEEDFIHINRPLAKVDWKRMIEGLKSLPAVGLQSLFVCGSYDNIAPKQIDEWIKVVDYIRPRVVQVYTVDRPTADPGILKVSRERLEEIAQRLGRRTGIEVVVYE